MYDGARKKAKARKEGLYWYARSHEFIDDTETVLLPNGKATGPCYVQGWEPCTKATTEYYLTELKDHLTKEVQKIYPEFQGRIN